MILFVEVSKFERDDKVKPDDSVHSIEGCKDARDTKKRENLYESQMILVRFAGAMLHSRRVGMKPAIGGSPMETYFALRGQSMAPACGPIAIRISYGSLRLGATNRPTHFGQCVGQ